MSPALIIIDMQRGMAAQAAGQQNMHGEFAVVSTTAALKKEF
jgi:nicotinamidase-related amidase